MNMLFAVCVVSAWTSDMGPEAGASPMQHLVCQSPAFGGF